jgi:hypothetical protein
MYLRPILMVLLVFLVPQGKQNPKETNSNPQTSATEERLAACQQQLKNANATCKKIVIETETRDQEKYDQLKAEYTGAENRLRDSEKTVADLQGQLGRAKDRLNAADGEIANKVREIDGKNRDIDDKNKEIARLNAMSASLKEDMKKLGLDLKSREQARDAAEQARKDLQQKFEAASAQQKKDPDAMVALMKQAQIEMDQNGAPTAVTPGKDGSFRRELVIGTLEIKPYPTQVPADGKLQLVALFTPHPLPGITGNSPWYVKLAYNPPPGVNAPFSQNDSLGEEDRKVLIGSEHKWVWIVDMANNYRADLTPTQIDILAGFEPDKVQRIAGQSVVLTREKPNPGVFARAFATLKENLTYILGTIAALCGIWGALITVKLKRLELEKSAGNLNQGQTAPPPT